MAFYVESYQSLQRHPKTKKAARLLECSIPCVMGHLHCLWYWCLDYAESGDLSDYDNADIADACMWEGDAQTLIHGLVMAGFLDCSEEDEPHKISVHDWYDYGGKLIEKRNANAERMRLKRTSANSNVDGNARAEDVQRTFALSKAKQSKENLSKAKQSPREESNGFHVEKPSAALTAKEIYNTEDPSPVNDWRLKLRQAGCSTAEIDRAVTELSGRQKQPSAAGKYRYLLTIVEGFRAEGAQRPPPAEPKRIRTARDVMIARGQDPDTGKRIERPP